MTEQTAPRIAQPIVAVHDGDYTLILPVRERYDFDPTDEGETIEANVFGADTLFVSVRDRAVSATVHMTPAAAHALAEAIHAVANRIVEVRLNRFPDGRGGWAHDPEIVLDNGRSIRFVTEETDVDEYGVTLVIVDK